jgi:hypothetical protein
MNYIKLFDNKQYIPYNGDDNNIVFNKKELIIIINFLCQKKLISKRIFNSFLKEYEKCEKNNIPLFFSSNKMELMVFNYLIVLHIRYSHPTISKINDNYYILSIKGIKYKCDQLDGLKKCINNEGLKFHI